jgi:hypothetical protein
MEKKYHYATVSKALEELKEKGFTYDFNLHEDDIVKIPTIIKLYTFTDMKEIQIQMMKQWSTE